MAGSLVERMVVMFICFCRKFGLVLLISMCHSSRAHRRTSRAYFQQRKSARLLGHTEGPAEQTGLKKPVFLVFANPTSGNQVTMDTETVPIITLVP